MKGTKFGTSRRLLPVAVLCAVTLQAMADSGAGSRTCRFLRYFDAVGRSGAEVNLVEQVVFSLFFIETGGCHRDAGPAGVNPT